ncbi:hypothetical protein EII25_03230 [Erysipelotrichaceae bacterium OH741_COT-311]|nr:hypothetical protein EII25_03230 [Erysipelotrichaceae bacterium OH741_COT-311]
MSLLETLRKDKMQALKDKDSVKNNVTTLLISSIALARKENSELTLQGEYALILKEIKQQNETLQLTPSSYEEFIAETKRKIEILKSYLPKQKTKEELKEAMETLFVALALPKSRKSQGIITKKMLEQFEGSTDGKAIHEAFNEMIQ